jgi:hypothetical protein
MRSGSNSPFGPRIHRSAAPPSLRDERELSPGAVMRDLGKCIVIFLAVVAAANALAILWPI